MHTFNVQERCLSPDLFPNVGNEHRYLTWYLKFLWYKCKDFLIPKN